MDDPDSDEEMKGEEGAGYSDSRPGLYQLNGIITHLGTGVHSGHYVCYVKREGKWIYYNDAKVATLDDPPIGKGYMYFFRKVDK